MQVAVVVASGPAAVLFAAYVTYALLTIVLLVKFLRLAWKEELDPGSRNRWILLLLFFGPFSMPLYLVRLRRRLPEHAHAPQ